MAGSMDTESYDLVILGSGSTAFAAAIRAAELGKFVVMTESRTLGGTCVNRGCLPSKNLIEAARIYWEAHRPRYPGLVPTGMDLNFRELIRQKDDIIHDYRDKKYQSIVHNSDRIKVYAGHAAFTPDGAVEVDGHRLAGTSEHGMAKHMVAGGLVRIVAGEDSNHDMPHGSLNVPAYLFRTLSLIGIACKDNLQGRLHWAWRG